jgi:hypothetical protein
MFHSTSKSNCLPLTVIGVAPCPWCHQFPYFPLNSTKKCKVKFLLTGGKLSRQLFVVGSFSFGDFKSIYSK